MTVHALSAGEAMTAEPVELYAASKHGHTSHELAALSLDAHVYEILPGTFVASHTQIDPSVRLRALGASVGLKAARAGVFARLTASWVFGCAPLPERLTLHVEQYHRPLPNNSPLPLLTLQAPVGVRGKRVLGELSVTSLRRTALDLAAYPEGQDSHQALVRLIRKYPETLDTDRLLSNLVTQRRASIHKHLIAAVRDSQRFTE
ncbi:hypothetical protein [Neomicrococcus lactis]|uniref:AbiEi antitoxin C-terminal domain-containing protein n=1 Tax=Neomicrococcus lactis TaxID=732241 RepID=A0A7W9DBA3_9MICC|nr:hypothetical protein [Neomicrococcus lactis]MBB5597652.1 hypothetical protein [Neomicrococcus lactis]